MPPAAAFHAVSTAWRTASVTAAALWRRLCSSSSALTAVLLVESRSSMEGMGSIMSHGIVLAEAG